MKKATIYFTFMLILGSIFLSIWGCNRKKEYIVPTTWTVFPLDSGKYRTYEVWDNTYTNTGDTVKSHYYRREVIGGKINFQARNMTMLYSYTTPDVQHADSFSLDRTWMIYKDSTQYAEVVKENVRELVLRYPMYVDSTYVWDPYLYADTDEKHNLRYRYLTLDSTVNINNLRFEHCVVVMESNKEDSLSVNNYRKAYTVYAPNVGKIIRYYKQINKSNGAINTTKSGTHIEKIIAHN